jgi:hypothetical protein
MPTTIDSDDLQVFLDKEQWWESHAGNPTRRYRGALVFVFKPKYGPASYRWGMQRQPDWKRPKYAVERFTTVKAAKIAAYEYITRMWPGDGPVDAERPE